MLGHREMDSLTLRDSSHPIDLGTLCTPSLLGTQQLKKRTLFSEMFFRSSCPCVLMNFPSISTPWWMNIFFIYSWFSKHQHTFQEVWETKKKVNYHRSHWWVFSSSHRCLLSYTPQQPAPEENKPCRSSHTNQTYSSSQVGSDPTAYCNLQKLCNDTYQQTDQHTGK